MPGVSQALIDFANHFRPASSPGIEVGTMSEPILSQLGFVKVGWRRFYPDIGTA